MSARCPEGHLSEALDYCDVCGAPMGAASGGSMTSGESVPSGEDQLPDLPVGPSDPALQAPAGGPAAQTCPHCGALNVADALFCEACGYDFTTGTPPMGSEEDGGADGRAAEAGADSPSAPVSSAGAAVQPTKVGHSAASGQATADEEDAAEDNEPDPQTGDREPDAPSAPVPSPGPAQQATEVGHSGPSDTGGADPEPAAAATTAHRKARHTPPSRALAATWVVELWVDPDWYAVQQTEEACPSAGVPDIVLLTRSAALVGRPSGSLGVRPEVDAGADSAVSRRHAQLTSDGQRWWVEDLGSSNGTFVGTVGEPLPTTPIPPGQRVEIDRDDRLYVGAWTRIVLRQATASERRGTG